MSSARTLLFLTAALQSVVPTSGHSYLAAPLSRNGIASANGMESCPHCLQAGGPATVKTRADSAGGSWPTATVPSSHGLCGDPVQNTPVTDWMKETYLAPTPVQETYTAGEIVEFVIGISTHHMGHYEFRLCNKVLSNTTISSPAEGQACLDSWVLERAPLDPTCTPDNGVADCQPIDPATPGRWYVPPPNEGTSPGDTIGTFPYNVGEAHRMRYKIPEGFSCDHCTLQWYWSTGNSCLYDEHYFNYFQVVFPNAGWTGAGDWCPWCVQSWANCDNACCGVGQRSFGEEFWNCADIAVMGDGGSPPLPPTTTTTTTTTTLAASTSTTGPVTPSACNTLGVCEKLNNTMLGYGCQYWNGNEAACSSSYITHGAIVAPCEWVACSNLCVAKGAAMMPCEEASLSCSCTSKSSWSNAACRSNCHAHPTWCSSDCFQMCDSGCSCNALAP